MCKLTKTPLTLAVVGFCVVVGSCAPRVIPAPVVTTPRYPEFVRPDVPASAALGTAAQFHDRSWRFLQSGDVRGAEREIALALKASPGFYPAEAMSGYVALARAEPQAALEHFDKVLSEETAYPSALVGRGQALLALNREPEAIESFESALAVNPSLTDLRRRVEVLRFAALEREVAVARRASNEGRLQEAAGAYRTAIERSPNSAFLHRELGLVERSLGNVDQAWEQFRQAFGLDPFDAASVAQMAAIVESRGELDEALRLFDQSLGIEPSATVQAQRNALVARMELARLPAEYQAIGTVSELTRADLAALIGVRLGDRLPSAASGGVVVITDVRGNWAEPWIMAVATADVMPPYDNHTFQPGGAVRRIDLAQAVSRLLPLVSSAEQMATWQKARVTFGDVSGGHLAYPSASAAVAAGVMRRTADQNFEPSRIVTGTEAISAIEVLQTLADREGSRTVRRP